MGRIAAGLCKIHKLNQCLVGVFSLRIGLTYNSHNAGSPSQAGMQNATVTIRFWRAALTGPEQPWPIGTSSVIPLTHSTTFAISWPSQAPRVPRLAPPDRHRERRTRGRLRGAG